MCVCVCVNTYFKINFHTIDQSRYQINIDIDNKRQTTDKYINSSTLNHQSNDSTYNERGGNLKIIWLYVPYTRRNIFIN